MIARVCLPKPWNAGRTAPIATRQTAIAWHCVPLSRVPGVVELVAAGGQWETEIAVIWVVVLLEMRCILWLLVLLLLGLLLLLLLLLGTVVLSQSGDLVVAGLRVLRKGSSSGSGELSVLVVSVVRHILRCFVPLITRR